AAAVADHPLVLHAAVLAAGALPVLLGPEDPLAEQAVLLRPVGPVVDGLRLLDLAEGPAPDVVGTRQPELDCAIIIDTIVGAFGHGHGPFSCARLWAVRKGGWFGGKSMQRSVGFVRIPIPRRVAGIPKKSPRADPLASGKPRGCRGSDGHPGPLGATPASS